MVNDKYEMGDMPEASESEGEELAMEGADFESPAEETSPAADLISQLAGLDKDSLKEIEAAIADELSKQEEGEADPDAEAAEPADLGDEAPSDDEAGGDLSSLFG